MNEYIEELLNQFPNKIDLEEPLENIKLPKSTIYDGLHSVIVQFNHGLDYLDDVIELEDELNKRLDSAKQEYYDGHELGIDIDDGRLYFYAPNALTLFNKIQPILKSSRIMKNAQALLRFGDVFYDSKTIIKKL